MIFIPRYKYRAAAPISSSQGTFAEPTAPLLPILFLLSSLSCSVDAPKMTATESKGVPLDFTVSMAKLDLIKDMTDFMLDLP